MADIRWIKIAVDMFEDDKIEFIRSMPEGDAIIVIWIQMLSIAGKSNRGGYLMVADGIPYTEQLLATKLRRTPVIMQFALETLDRLKLINLEDGPYHITNWEKHQNIDGMERIKSQNRERKRVQREKEKLLLSEGMSRDSHVTSHAKSHVMSQQCHATDIEKEKELKDIPDSDECGDGFKQFWSLYPSKKGKANAEKSWKVLWKKGLDMNHVMTGTQSYIDYCRVNERPFKDGSTFVNQQSWNDDWTLAPSGFPKGPKQYVANRTIPQPEVSQASQEELDFFARGLEKQRQRNGVSFDH